MRINIKNIKNMITPSEKISICKNNLPFDKEAFPDILNIETLVVSGIIENKNSFLKIIGTIDISLNSVCSRCLEETKIDLNITFSEEYYDGQAQQDISEGDEKDFKYYTGNEIDLQPLLIELLILEIPLNQLCKENCLGLCYKCGQNLNEKDCDCDKRQTDIRLLELEKLLDNT